MSEPLPSAPGGSRLRPVGMILGLLALILVGMWIGVSRRAPELVPSLERSRAELDLRSGRLYFQGQSNLFTGYLVERYPGGELQSRSAISNGLMQGVSEGWYTNGVLALRESFMEGKSHGMRTKWDMNSIRISETSIREGQVHGLHREWYTNGQIMLEVPMVDGKATGVARKWNSDASLAGQWTLSNGVVVDHSSDIRISQGSEREGNP